MKKLLAVVSALSVVLAAASVGAGAANYYGDVDKNGEINSADALAILEYSVGKTTEIDVETADISKDGQVNSTDALAVLMTAVGVLPVEEIPEKPTEPDEPDEPVKDPTQYSQKEIIEYYNKAVDDSYSKVTAVKSVENVKINVDSIKPGGPGVTNLVAKVVDKYSQPTTVEKAIKDRKAVDSINTLDYYAACSNIDFEGVKEASVVKEGKGYKVSFTVISENADLANPPKYNSQCSRPLDINSIDLMGAQVTKANYVYTGTVITVVIDESGKITSSNVTMPIKVEGSGKLGIKVDVVADGTYTNDSVFTY